jgi:3-oxochol-4-en-24-oyl-CoA dehydrogenase
VPIAITDEQLALQASIRDWAKRAGTLALVRGLGPALPSAGAGAGTRGGAAVGGAGGPAAWGRCWSDLAGLGVFSIALPARAGGAGGAIADLAAGLEQITDALVPGPVMPTLLAGLALADHAELPVVKALLPDLAAGQASVAVGLAAGTVTGAWLADGSLRVSGDAGLMLGGGSTSHLLMQAATSEGVACFLLAAGQPGVKVVSRTPVDFSRTLADIALADAVIAPDQVIGGLATERVGDLAATLHAIEAVAVAGWCCRTAAEYARTRHQFGRPIGSFQAVKHLCAGMLCRAERATALAWDAVRAIDEAPAEHPLAAAAAAAVALDAAVDNAKDCIQRAALADSGYAAPQWPEPYGLSASPAALIVIDEELSRAGLSRPDLVIGGWAVPAIVSHGTQAQRERFAGPTLRGEITWCQLFSEPEAGSDLASLRTRAVRVDGGWELTGQKVWTSLAREADWAICLARTDPAVPRHRGLTFFLVAMDSPGIEIRPLREITGRAVFNEVFLDGVFVPDDCVVGAAGAGWQVARTTLATERVAMGRGSALGDAVEGLVAAVASAQPGRDTGTREELGALVAEGLAVSLMDLRSTLAQLTGADQGPHSAVRKLVGVAHRQSVAEAALTLSGADAAAADGAGADPVHEFLLTRCLSIAGGTTQILLSVVAERVLGLPREEVR